VSYVTVLLADHHNNTSIPTSIECHVRLHAHSGYAGPRFKYQRKKSLPRGVISGLTRRVDVFSGLLLAGKAWSLPTVRCAVPCR
jgi:hypothetical protein